MEVAALGKPIVIGPHTENFAEPVAAFSDADALRVVNDEASLAGAVATLLSDKKLAEELGRRAREVVIDHQGATRLTADRIAALLSQGADKNRAGQDEEVAAAGG